jgi:threonine dehydratase
MLSLVSAAPAARLPTRAERREGVEFLECEVARTPVRRFRLLERMLERPVWIKLEQQQETGSFKLRGALNCLRQIPATTPIVTASAGNHALAMAHAAAITGHALLVCLPRSVGAVLRERLAGYAVALVEHGDTLEEACDHARKLTASRGGEFVSPYNDGRLIAGHATAAGEFLHQVPDLACLVVPAGGGGLLAGVALTLADRGSDLTLVGCQPERFAPLAAAMEGGEEKPPVHRASLADALIVGVERTAMTVAPARSRVDRMVLVSEEELAAGVYALLHRESLLVEPSGAAGAAAALAGKLDGVPGKGPLGILLTGGNLTSETLARALTYPFRNPRLARAVGLVGGTASAEPVLAGPRRLPGAAPPAGNSWSALAAAKDRFAGVEERAAKAVGQWRELERYCLSESLALPEEERAAGDDLARLTERLVDALRREVEGSGPSGDASGRHRVERLERAASQASAFVDTFSAWQAPSQAEATAATFSRVVSQDGARADYARFGSRPVAELEEQLLGVAGFDPARASLLMTSSGMAAYTLLESYLVRHVLRPGDAVLLPEYVYFETHEQITSLPGIRVVVEPSNDPATIVAAVLQHRPRVVFLDPLANTAALRVTKVPAVLTRLSAELRDPCWVVVDGTLLSGAFDPFERVTPDGPLSVLYYESASKYLELGLDLAPAGLCAAPLELSAILTRLRRNTGTVLFEAAAAMMPRFDRAHFLARMVRLTRNATRLGERLGARREVASDVEVVFPGLRSHPDYLAGRTFPHLGGVVALRFRREGLNHRDLLAAFIARAVAEARPRDVPLASGTSFGFSIPRLTAASALAEGRPPFLRLSLGDQDDAETDRLADLLGDVLLAFVHDCAHRLGRETPVLAAAELE